jgi:hypothetical protein
LSNVLTCVLRAVKLDRQKGMSIPELMIGLATFSILLVGTINFVDNVITSTDKLTANDARDQIASEIRKTITNFSNIESSSEKDTSSGNKKLKNCLTLSKNINCNVTDAAKQVSFDLFQNDFSGATRKVAGSNSSPVNFTRFGFKNCDTKKAHCPFFQARAYFWATCKSGATCKRAEAIHVRFQVKPVKSNYKGKTILSNPPDKQFDINIKKSNAIRFAVTYDVSEEMTEDENCNSGAIQIGREKNGDPICRCRFNFQETGKDSQGKIICQETDVACKRNEVTKGFNKDGTPICTTLKTVCTTVYLETDSAGCPNSGWMEAIDLGRCTAPKAAKKGGGKNEIKCAKNQAKCCWREVK